jgi:hypothetical protein
MAVTQAIFTPMGGSTNGTATADIVQISNITANANGTGEIVLGAYQLFSINANADVWIRFGNQGMPNANSAIDYRIPSNTVQTYQMSKQNDRLRCLGAGAANSNTVVYIQRLTAQG